MSAGTRPHLLADELDQRVEIELADERLADPVDGLELGGPRIRFRQEPLRLLEQPRVVERDAHVRKRREQALVVVAVRVPRSVPIAMTPIARSPAGIGTPRYDSVPETLNGAPIDAASSADPTRIGRPVAGSAP